MAYERFGEEHLEKRSLQKKAGWSLLWGLGVGAVISGEHFGWNFGLSAGGFRGICGTPLRHLVLSGHRRAAAEEAKKELA